MSFTRKEDPQDAEGEVFYKPATSRKQQIESERIKSISETTVYINAGGRGKRMESIFKKGEKGITKALLDFNGKPMVQSHSDLFQRLGFKNIIIGAGDHFNIKQHYAGQENTRLQVVNTEIQENTAGDLIKAIRGTGNLGDNILVENVDTLLYLKNINDLLEQHQKTNALATIVLTTKSGVPNENAFFVDETGKVIFSREANPEYGLIEPRDWAGLKASSTGVVIFKTEFLRNYSWQAGERSLSIYQDLLPELIKKGELYAYNNGKKLFVDTGTPESYHQIQRHVKKLFSALCKKYLDQDK